MSGGAGPLSVALLLVVAGCSAEPRGDSVAALQDITPDDIRSHVQALSHDSLRGRDTDDVGYVRARDYVVAAMEGLGLEPLFDESYLQPFDLLEVAADTGSTMQVADIRLDHADLIVTPDWRGAEPTVTGEGFFAGYELVTGLLGAGEGGELAGRIVFVLAGTPPGRTEEPLIQERKRAEVELALRAGGAAVIVLNPEMPESAWSARLSPRRPPRVLADGSAPYPSPAAHVSPAASRRLIDAWGPDPGPVGSVALSRLHRLRRVTTWNVGGRLPGQDPEVAGEAVVFTAHLDHVGVGPPDSSGDSIFNGAHDNALGIGKMLASAEALRSMPLRRSVHFLALGAEESGLLGSWHYLKNPTIPPSAIVVSINHDGGLTGPRHDDVFAWGPEFSTVEEDVAWAAQETGIEYRRPPSDAPFSPSAGLLYRSDHYPFLISGIPAVYLMPGYSLGGDSTAGRAVWEDYLSLIHHRRSDNFDGSAPYDSPVALTAMSVRLAWRLANASEMPSVHPDAPGLRNREGPRGHFYGPLPR